MDEREGSMASHRSWILQLAGLWQVQMYRDREWMEEQARNMTMEERGCLRGCRYLLHDRDAKFCQSFRELIKTGSVNPLRLPARSPNLNSYAERWVRSVKEECLSRLILFGESSLRRALQQYIVHYHDAKTIGSCFLRGRRQGRTWEQCGVENDWGAC